MKAMGIDVGGSGIKSALVDTEKGTLVSERIRTETPQPATPELVRDVIIEQIHQFKWEGTVGMGFPAVVQNGIVRTASNIDKSWIGLDANKLFTGINSNKFQILNDADAAGYAEMKFGAGQNNSGLVILITIGTGIGTAIFCNGKILPNTELGHLILIKGMTAEEYASDATRKEKELNWDKWAKRINLYLETLEKLFSPDLFIIGGGASKKYMKIEKNLNTRAKIVPAQLRNEAGIIGAALTSIL